MTITLKDGVYIGLKDEVYFAQDRLGSTDMSVLHKDPASWWYGSRHNPNRHEREVSEEMQFGSALHALVLEGEEAYADRAEISPFEDFRTKEARVWRDDAVIRGKIIMTEDMDRRVRHMAALILNHPELGAPMRGGLSEVAVLWTDPTGVKMRAKFDKLLPAFVVDLKTFSGDAKGRTTKEQCTGLVAGRSMDVQRFLYFQARQRMASLPVIGGTPAEQDWLRKVATVEAWDWCWIFYRRRDDKKSHAPVIQPVLRPHLGVTFDSGRRKTEVALSNYIAFRERFGFTVPWAVVEPSWEPVDHDFPPWLNEVCEPVTFPAEQGKAA